MSSRNQELDTKIINFLVKLGYIVSSNNLDVWDFEKDVYISGKGHYYIIIIEASGKVYGKFVKIERIQYLGEDFVRGKIKSYVAYYAFDLVNIVKSDKDYELHKKFADLYFSKSEMLDAPEYIEPPSDLENYYFVILINREEFRSYYHFCLKNNIQNIINCNCYNLIYDAKTLKEMKYSFKLVIEED
jgi:hypothetical protein